MEARTPVRLAMKVSGDYDTGMKAVSGPELPWNKLAPPNCGLPLLGLPYNRESPESQRSADEQVLKKSSSQAQQ